VYYPKIDSQLMDSTVESIMEASFYPLEDNKKDNKKDSKKDNNDDKKRSSVRTF